MHISTPKTSNTISLVSLLRDVRTKIPILFIISITNGSYTNKMNQGNIIFSNFGQILVYKKKYPETMINYQAQTSIWGFDKNDQNKSKKKGKKQ